MSASPQEHGRVYADLLRGKWNDASAGGISLRIASKILCTQAVEEPVKAHPVNGTILFAGALRVKQVLTIRRHILSPAMRQSIIDLQAQAHRLSPREVLLAK